MRPSSERILGAAVCLIAIGSARTVRFRSSLHKTETVFWRTTSFLSGKILPDRDMKTRTAARKWVGPEYRVRVSFRAPIDFVFAWCTDYTPGDAALEKEAYQRKVIKRTPREVVFEDLEESKDGWDWSRAVVSLHRPTRWHMDGIGNNRDVMADYALSSLPDGRTRLDLRWKRRPRVPDSRKLTRAEREASATRSWENFAAALERDYKRSVRGGRRGKK